MGRELRRKQAKKDGKSLEKEEIIETGQVKKYLKTVILLVIILFAIYAISANLRGELNWFGTKTTDSDTNKVNNQILASATFRQTEEEYYVYFYDFNEEDKDSLITTLVENALGSSKIYRVDTSSSYNANYLADNGNKNAQSLDELRIVSPTLIKIKNEKIVEYYEKDEIKAKLS